MWYYSLLLAPAARPVHRLEEAAARVALPPNRALQLDGSKAGLYHVLDLHGPLFVRVNRVVFPVVLAHELGVRVKAAPVVFVVCENLLDIFVVLSGAALI